MPDETPVLEQILDLADNLIRMPSVTVGERVRLDAVLQAADFIEGYLQRSGLEVRRFDQGDYPALLATFPGGMEAPVMLSGHFDVVAPEPDDKQFEPRREGDYLWGRGAADMKTVVATYLVWMSQAVRQEPYPQINLLLVGNEETGEVEPMGTGHVLAQLSEEGYQPEILIAGERTEEQGTGVWGQVCLENRGVVRFCVAARGVRGHSGLTGASSDLTQKLIRARNYLAAMSERHLRVNGVKSWRSQVRFPFIQVGTPDVYNITPDIGLLGVEIRTLPGDRVEDLVDEFSDFAFAENLEIQDLVIEPGSSCDTGNPHLLKLLEAIRRESGAEPVLGRKLAGTSARFAPGGNGVVWGQSGIGPHSAEERHYIPSIMPYYRALDTFARLTISEPDQA